MLKRMTLLSAIGLLLPSLPALAAVPVPEYWSSRESFGYFAVVFVAFAMLLRFNVLKSRAKP